MQYWCIPLIGLERRSTPKPCSNDSGAYSGLVGLDVGCEAYCP